ncbi:MAG: cyclic nucleotide-binding domain-containing protein [Crocinitomix sp.]|nr:cyclic nucleotide-binding domain-containing protein [Crocinitomix sp.]
MKNQDLAVITSIYFSEADVMHIELEKGETLFNIKDSVSHIYFLKKGELSILKNNQLIWQSYHDEFIGISSYFNKDLYYSYEVKTNKKSTLLKIAIADFESALQKFPALNKELMKLFNDRINLTLERAQSHLTLTRKKRLLRILVEKVEHNQNGYIFNYTVKEIAEFVGVPLNFAKRTLDALQDKKLICLIQNSIEIIDFKGLKRAALG